jgi:hypothetical protein
MLYAQGCVWVWMRRHSAPLRRWLARPFAGVAALFGMLGLTVGVLAATDTLILFADPAIGRRLVAGLFVPVWVAYYATYLFVRYRRGYPVAMVWLLLLLAYLPVYNTVTWYYTTIGWLFRASYWALVAQIAWRHWGLDAVARLLAARLHVALPSFARLPVKER